MDKQKKQEGVRDHLIRDIPLMQRYARSNEREDVQFRNQLKFTLNISNKELDAEVSEITEDVWSRIDCTQCAYCCKTMQIEVNAADIARLANHLGMSVKAFTQRYLQIAEDNAKIMNSLPCPFLGEDNRCMVYEQRPEACREFPFLHKPDFRSRSLLMLANLEVCPITFNVWQELKARYGRRKRRR